MAKTTPWSERTVEQRRRTLGGFGAMYAVIALSALVLGWTPVGLIFGIGAIALGIAWTTTKSPADGPVTDRVKPDWMLAMDDPDAPDLSLPEYNTERRTLDDPTDSQLEGGGEQQRTDPTPAPPSREPRSEEA